MAVCFFLGLFWVNLLQGAIIDNYCRLIEQMGSGALVCCARCAEHAVLSMPCALNLTLGRRMLMHEQAVLLCA